MATKSKIITIKIIAFPIAVALMSAIFASIFIIMDENLTFDNFTKEFVQWLIIVTLITIVNLFIDSKINQKIDNQ